MGPPLARLSLVVGPGDKENIRTNWSANGGIFGGGFGGNHGEFSGQPFGFVRPRKSICEPIREEGEASLADSDLAALEDLAVYKRHHRPRPPLPSAPSPPTLISTSTTKPVYINHQCTRYYPTLLDGLRLALTTLPQHGLPHAT